MERPVAVTGGQLRRPWRVARIVRSAPARRPTRKRGRGESATGWTTSDHRDLRAWTPPLLARLRGGCRDQVAVTQVRQHRNGGGLHHEHSFHYFRPTPRPRKRPRP